MRRFVAHCGYYDRSIASGIFEHHVDLLVAADDFEAAKAGVKRHPDFVARSMHLGGLMAVEAVDGFRVELVADAALDGRTLTPRTPSSWRVGDPCPLRRGRRGLVPSARHASLYSL